MGWTPLGYAALDGHKEIVELLISKDADVDVMDRSGGTPLSYAAIRGHKEM